MLTLESRRFPVLGEVSCFIRILPNRLRNRARNYYIIVEFAILQLTNTFNCHNTIAFMCLVSLLAIDIFPILIGLQRQSSFLFFFLRLISIFVVDIQLSSWKNNSFFEGPSLQVCPKCLFSIWSIKNIQSVVEMGV